MTFHLKPHELCHTSGRFAFENTAIKKCLLICSTLDVYMVNANKSVPSGKHFFLSVKEYSGALVVAGQGDDHAACSSGDGTFSELEQLLKQKTFTR